MSGLVRPGLFSLMGCGIEDIECAGRDMEVSRIYKEVVLSKLLICLNHAYSLQAINYKRVSSV